MDVSGYGASGKGVVVDLLREFRGYHVPPVGPQGFAPFEFLLLRIQGGILDLEDALSNGWSPIRSDAAIRRFKHLIKRLGTKTRLYDPRTWLSGTGWNYDQIFDHRFTELSNDYIGRLVNATWVADWPFSMADMGGFELFLRKVKRRLGFKSANDFKVYLSFPDDFVSHTRDYLEALLSSTVSEDIETIVLQNAFEPFQPSRSLRFFESAKSIVVERDPRDVYADQPWYRPMRVSVSDFIYRYRVQREASNKFFAPDENVLLLRFEDLVTEYDRTVARIQEHLGEEPSSHVHPGRYLDVEASKKNIGLWKHFHSPEEIELVRRELKDYCYD